MGHRVTRVGSGPQQAGLPRPLKVSCDDSVEDHRDEKLLAVTDPVPKFVSPSGALERRPRLS